MFNPRKPLQVLVGNTSTLVIPAATPVEGDILTYAISTAYTYGQIVQNGSRIYWVYVAGTSGTGDGPEHDDGDAADGTVTFRRLHGVRNKLTLVNDSDVNIYLGFTNAAEANKGARLNSEGGAWNSGTGRDCPQGAIYAISESGSDKKLGVQEA